MDIWIKVIHIIFVVSWFAGLFYLPRLFVYHATVDVENEQAAHNRFITMETKLYKIIIVPSSLIATFSGVWLAHSVYDFQGGWIHAKLILVFLLWIYQYYCRNFIFLFSVNKNTKSHVWFRWFNEGPTIVLIASIILVVLKPF